MNLNNEIGIFPISILTAVNVKGPLVIIYDRYFGFTSGITISSKLYKLCIYICQDALSLAKSDGVLSSAPFFFQENLSDILW